MKKANLILLLSMPLLSSGSRCFAQQTAGAEAYVSGGSVTSVVVTNGGFGYSVPPVVSLSGGGGSGAEATAAITGTGTVYQIAVTAAGTGYTSSPTVEIEPPLFDLSDGLVGYWPFEGNVDDASTNEQNGTISGDISYTNGMVGNCAEFNGSTFVDFGSPTNGSFDIAPGQDCSIGLWVKTAISGSANWPQLLDKDAYCEGQYIDRGWTMFFNTSYGGGPINGQLVWGVSGGVETPGAINDNQWHYIVCSKGGTNLTMYLDGALVSTGSLPESSWYPNSESMRLAADQGCFSYFNGYVDELRFYKRDLTHREIEALYLRLPVITQPQPTTVYFGASAAFSTTASGDGPFSYQWFLNGQPIASATNAVLTVPYATATGEYSVSVSNAYGTVYSQQAMLTVKGGIALNLYPGLTISGAVSQVYGIQYSTNLGNTNGWIGVTNLTLTQPIEIWYDSVPATLPERFYRVLPGPIPIP